MKKIFILTLIINSLLFSQIIDESKYHNLKSIAISDWKNSDNRIKSKLVNDFNKYIPTLLNVVKKPLRHNQDKYRTNLQISSQEYYFVLSYIRYLESSKNIDTKKIVNIYKALILGIKSIKDNKNSSLIDVSFMALFNELIINSLSNTISKNYLDKEELQKISKIFTNSVIFDNKLFIQAIKNDFNYLGSYYENERNIEKFIKNKNIKQETKISEIYENLQKLSIYVKEECSREKNDIIDIINNTNYTLLQDKIKKYNKSLIMQFKSENILKRVANIDKKSDKNLSQDDIDFILTINAKSICSTVLGSNLDELNSKFLEIASRNKHLLKILEDKLK